MQVLERGRFPDAVRLAAVAVVCATVSLETVSHLGAVDLPAPASPILDRLLAIEADSRALCPETLPPDEARHQVDRLAADVRTRLGVRASTDLHDPCNLLPSAVMQRRQGYCLGVAALYLALAERAGVPIYAVGTPAHVFLRYDDGTARINIETTAAGAARADDAYIREGRIPPGSIRKGVFMRNLTPDEFLAQVHSNLGVIHSERRDDAAAAREYERATDLDRSLPAAWYNQGNDLLRAGEFAQAIRMFDRSLRLYPTDVWALNNRGRAFLAGGRAARARRDLEEALRLDPSFDPAKRNLAECEKRPECARAGD